MANNDYHRIMQEVAAGLTGDSDRDMTYLVSQLELYKDHEMSMEILRGIGRMIAEILPEDKKSELARIMNNSEEGWKAALEEADYCRYKGDFAKACSLLEGMITDLEGSGMFTDDEVSEYKDFQEPFEDALYKYRFDPKKTVRAASFPYTGIYMRYGSALFELHEHEKAKAALRSALRWNPVSADAAFELAENYKVTGDLETFYAESLKAHRICYRASTLARCYRNLAFYYSEMRKYREATACITVSGLYDMNAANLQSELFFIEKMNGSRIDLTADEVHAILKKENIPDGPDDEVVGLAYFLGNEFAGKNPDAAEYFYGIVYELTGDDEVRQMIDRVEAARKMS